MKVLLHVCCGPCTIYPLRYCERKGQRLPDIFTTRISIHLKNLNVELSTLQDYARRTRLPLVLDTNYGLKDFIRKVAFHEEKRCDICYLMRLEKTVSLAREMNFEAFSTTLLYSKYQRHSQLILQCQQLSAKYDIPFYYRDFREGWQAGIDASKDLEMYRQPYCGCIYSEQERYDKSLRKG